MRYAPADTAVTYVVPPWMAESPVARPLLESLQRDNLARVAVQQCLGGEQVPLEKWPRKDDNL